MAPWRSRTVCTEAGALSQLASIQALRGRWTGAAQTYATLEAATKDWERARKDEVELDISSGRLYLSPRLSGQGQHDYPNLEVTSGVVVGGTHVSSWHDDLVRALEALYPAN